MKPNDNITAIKRQYYIKRFISKLRIPFLYDFMHKYRRLPA